MPYLGLAPKREWSLLSSAVIAAVVATFFAAQLLSSHPPSLFRPRCNHSTFALVRAIQLSFPST